MRRHANVALVQRVASAVLVLKTQYSQPFREQPLHQLRQFKHGGASQRIRQCVQGAAIGVGPTGLEQHRGPTVN